MARPMISMTAIALVAVMAATADGEDLCASDDAGLGRAVAGAKPGTTVLIAPGNYRGGFAARGLRGEPGSPITLRASDPRRPPVFRGGPYGLHLSAVAHVELRDLIVERVAGDGINIDDGGVAATPAHHVVLRGLVVRDIGPGGNRDGIKLSGVDDFRVEGCRVERWIIRVVDRPDPRPVWVLIWGGSADLAQALWKVRATRSPDELARFLAKLRVHAIGDQDSTGPWIRDQFPGLYTITQRRAYRGMYRGGDAALASSARVKANIHGHGPLGDLYPDYDGGDIWSSTLGQVRGIKEGDTPSFLSPVPNGLGDAGHPRLGSWGGRFEGDGNRLTDVADADVDAAGTTDPDGDDLDFSWGVYPATAESSRKVVIEGRDTRFARLVVAPELVGRTIPILLTVTDRVRPKLSRYGRVLITVRDDGGRPEAK